MRIIQIFGPTIRDDGGAFYIHKFMNKLPGVTVERKEAGVPFEEWGEYDGVIYVDWGQDAFKVPEPVFPQDVPCVLWLSDTHMSEKSRANRFRWAIQAGPRAKVMFYHPEALTDFEWSQEGPDRVPSSWLPAAADHTVYTPPLPHDDPGRSDWPADPSFISSKSCEIVPRHDWCWVGHIGDDTRDEILHVMCEKFPRFTFWSGIFFEQAARVFHESAVVFNKSVRGDFNMRSFEALSSRSFLLTDRQRGMEELGLKDGEHCAIYEDEDEAVAKMDYYLERPALRRRIAEAGWRWVLKEHTYAHRARTFLGLLTA